MVDSDRSTRRDLVVLLLAGLLCVVASALASGESTRRAVVEDMASRSLSSLAFLAGLRDEGGASLRDEPLEVTVIQEGGSSWIRDAVLDAVENSRDFAAADSRHLLRIESIEDDHVIALQLRLWRQGWDLRSPDLMRGRVSPWAPVLAGALGAVVAFLLWRIAPGLLVAGVISQALLAGIPWPSQLIPPVDWSTEVKAGPLLGPWLEAPVPAWLTPAAFAVIVFCMVLVVFDHRRSKDGAGSMALGAVGFAAVSHAVGAGLWIEAALRGGVWASMHGIVGALAALALAVAWVPALRRSWERLRR